MLVLTRKKDEKIVIGESITITVIDVRGDTVRLGIDAPRDVSVHRQEVYEAIQRENLRNAAQAPPDGQNPSSAEAEASAS